MTVCSDIIYDIFKLEENYINITCCAENWMRIPKIAPDKIINIRTADNLVEIEEKCMFYDNALSEIRRENDTTENRMNGIEKSIGPDKSPPVPKHLLRVNILRVHLHQMHQSRVNLFQVHIRRRHLS